MMISKKVCIFALDKNKMIMPKIYNDLITVKSAKYVGDFIILIIFNDGISRKVNFKPFLEKSHHPSIRQYLDENKFQEFQIIDGNLNWNDYELIFPTEDLLSGVI
jgi:hypothetical protein